MVQFDGSGEGFDGKCCGNCGSFGGNGGDSCGGDSCGGGGGRVEVVAVNVWKCNSFLCGEAVAAKVEVEALEVVMKVLSASLRRLFFMAAGRSRMSAIVEVVKVLVLL